MFQRGFLLLLQASRDVGNGIPNVVPNDLFDGLADLRMVADELSLWHGDGCADLHQSHVLPVVVLGDLEFVPEITLHLCSDDDFAAIVVDGGVWFGAFPSDAAFCGARKD